MFDGTPYRSELSRRVTTIRNMLDAADPSTSIPHGATIGREVRGLTVVLLFASYENLMKSLCRGLLEKAASLRVGNRRLRAGFRQFAVHKLLVSVVNSTEKQIWKDKGKKLLDCALESRKCSIDTNIFPADGSFIKKSQVALFCEIFELGDPGAVLKEAWSRLDTIVVQRNKIAHGDQTPEEVGRTYSHAEIRNLVDLWETRWLDFVAFVETAASTRSFYRN